ncbi:MAG: carbohydrate ABC transporter substrate-binding protein [Clostridia bacterium]|nr:carbohydrate ABC transporter substrate-binding protein [Clostridia bacterium]NCC42180.1 carbohydrate ABC transporter substrate-binding protein [Clostridia bacterium]
MKKRLLTMLMAGVLVVSMTACGEASGDSTQGTDSDAGAGKDTSAADTETTDSTDSASDTLTVWCWDPTFNIYAINTAADIYAKDHAGFSVDVTEILSDDIETRITTAVSAGDLSTLPDIFLMQDNSFQKYIANYPDVFTDLTDSGIDFSQFSQAKVAYSTFEGKNYAVPFDNGAAINCVRTDYLEQAGFTVDDFTDITWSEFIEKGKKVKEVTGYPMLTAQAGMPDLIMEMLQSCGASCFKEDGSVNIEENPAVKAAIETYQELVDTGVLQEVTDNDQYIGALNNGTSVGTVNGCWILGSIQAADDQAGKWAVTNIPSLDGIEGATNYSNNGGSSWVITSNCKNIELAEDFLNTTFAGSTEFYETILPSAGALSTWLPAGNSDVYGEPQDYFGGQAIYSDIVEFAGKIPSNITGPFYYDARDSIGVALSNIIQQGADIDAEIKTAQETVEFNMNA